MIRGVLSDEIQAVAELFLRRKITTTELRLYPYLDYVMKNNQKLDMRKINQEERNILAELRKEGHIEGGAAGLSMTKEFYDYIDQILWLAYVDIDE